MRWDCPECGHADPLVSQLLWGREQISLACPECEHRWTLPLVAERNVLREAGERDVEEYEVCEAVY